MKGSKSLSVGGLSFKYTRRQPSAVGFIVSKRYGNAVSRNLFKRRCRALFHHLFIKHNAGIALIIKPNVANISYSQIECSLGILYEKTCIQT